MKEKHKDYIDNANEIFLSLQDKYLETKDAAAWASMWELAIELSKKSIRQFMRKKGLRFSRSDVASLAVDAAMYVLRRYKRRPGYKILFIVTTMRFGVIHALFAKSPTAKLFESALSLDELKENMASCEKFLELNNDEDYL